MAALREANPVQRRHLYPSQDKGSASVNPEIEKKLTELCDSNQFMNHNGIQFKEISPGRAVFELRLTDASLNPYGFAHGGALYTMADCACGTAARSDGRRYVTLSSSFNFLRSGLKGETVQAVAHVRRRGRTTCYVDVELVNEKGDLLCAGNFIFYCIDA